MSLETESTFSSLAMTRRSTVFKKHDSKVGISSVLRELHFSFANGGKKQGTTKSSILACFNALHQGKTSRGW